LGWDVLPARVLEDVAQERALQMAEWPEDANSAVEWVAIAGKQLGQAAGLAVGLSAGDEEFVAALRHEFVQLAAVAMAAVESIDAGDLVLD
jgi:flagellar biosynthesis/type III secretory pathway protein FliH